MSHHDDDAGRGVDPYWNPLTSSRTGADDAGCGGDAAHPGGFGRVSRRMVVVLAVCTLLAAGAGVGMTVVSSRMGVRRQELASACEDAVASMGRAYGRLQERVARMVATIDVDALASSMTREYGELRSVAPLPSIDCDAGQGNKRLQEHAAKARRARQEYAGQAKRVRLFTRRAQGRAAREAARQGSDRLKRDLSAARSLLTVTADRELRVPYLRTRLADAVERAETLVSEGRDGDAMADMASTLEDLMVQVRQTAGL